MRVTGAEPSRKGAGIATAYDQGFLLFTCTLSSKETCKICESLLTGKIAEVLGLPVVEGLRFTVVSVFKDKELGSKFSANHKGEHAEVGDGAGVFTTDVKEDGAGGLVLAVHIVFPVALLVGVVTLVVPVVDGAFEEGFGEVSR